MFQSTGHPQGLREQHPDGVQQDSIFSSTLKYFICFMSSFSRQTDINWFNRCPSRLGHPQGLREQHPDGLQQDFTFSSNLNILTTIFSKSTFQFNMNISLSKNRYR